MSLFWVQIKLLEARSCKTIEGKCFWDFHHQVSELGSCHLDIDAIWVYFPLNCIKLHCSLLLCTTLQSAALHFSRTREEEGAMTSIVTLGGHTEPRRRRESVPAPWRNVRVHKREVESSEQPSRGEMFGRYNMAGVWLLE